MTLPPASLGRPLQIYLSLAQYPILSVHIRARMRHELFERGIISFQSFEAEVREKAVRSQILEGLHDPISEEPTEIWDLRLSRVRDHLTDFYFAYNLPQELFEKIIRETLAEHGANPQETVISFNPELAPQSLLFDRAMSIEKMQPEERSQADAHLREIKVVLIRTLISDQLSYLKIAKDWFTISDLLEIRSRKIGSGKVGGKSAGMLLAWRILQEAAPEDLRHNVTIPESFYLGADLLYTFMALNGLMHWNDQKYKLESQIRSEYPQLQAEFLKGDFPLDILERLRDLLDFVEHRPLVVRSSSLLEDNFGTSFAGKYESHFVPCGGSPEENLRQLTRAIIRIYASVFNPDALLYRRAKGLQDYDERMAILIQEVQGEQVGRYFMPHAAGVAFSRNLYRWSPKIRREDGFLRLVWGLGTRAVDRVGNDYPRLVALSHPLLHPESNPRDIRRYSQQYVDLLDLEENAFATKPIHEVLQPRYPLLRYLAQLDDGGYLVSLRSSVLDADKTNLVLTFDELFRRTQLAQRLSEMLRTLEKQYHAPVDTEFTAEVLNPLSPQPEVRISLLQCRPQSHLQESNARLPKNLKRDDIIFSTHRMAPPGRVSEIRYVVFILPEAYFTLPNQAARVELVKWIGHVNNALASDTFICVGPGRWGTSTPDLGVSVGYGDIYHTRALVELAGQGIGQAPEASFGTHFFQDLMEANIYPLAIYLDDSDVIFDRDFFYNSPNHLEDLFPGTKEFPAPLKLIKVDDWRPYYHIELIMDDEQGRVVAFLQADE